MTKIEEVIDTLSEEELDLLNNDPEMLAAFKAKYAEPESAIQVPPPQEALQSLAPSNIGKQAGMAAVNAPGVMSAAVNAIPGMGNPAAIPGAVQNIQQNPGQVKKAFQRGMAVSQGQPMTPQEKIPGYGGMAAGMALEAYTSPLSFEGIKATGPFTAGLKQPSSALPGALGRAGDELGAAKRLARVTEDTAEASRLRKMLSKEGGVAKVADEAIKVLERTQHAETTHLLAYREALGRMQAKGGVFADDYKQAFDKVTKLLAERSPELAKELSKYATTALAKEGPEFSFPALTTAVNPAVGALKAGYNMTQMAPVRAAAGALTGIGTNVATFDALLKAYDRLSKKRK